MVEGWSLGALMTRNMMHHHLTFSLLTLQSEEHGWARNLPWGNHGAGMISSNSFGSNFPEC